MKEIDWSVLSTVMSSVIAVIAIVAPVISSAISTKSQERSKANEIYLPRVYDALEDMSIKYSLIPRNSTAYDENSIAVEYLETLDRIRDFRGSCYTLMSLIPCEGIQQQIVALLDTFDSSLSPTKNQDAIFCELMKDTTEYLRSSKVKKPKKHAKDQR